ncbi:DUF2851 family protein [Myroides injenensis]|uniref:DUF2851 family protein n=1 Tax=Myroides injenensis TaxID=1183151 RepID=UPI000289B9D6|nr:DUF2851 family protein [Myroides injenensis]
MKEAFLHYIWQNQLFSSNDLFTSSKEQIKIISPGVYTGLDGPDFFNAQLFIGTQLWAGNVKIHIKASDWYAHHHEKDRRYDSVILHVVWEYDIPIYRECGAEISVFEIKNIVCEKLVTRYEYLKIPKQYLFCENDISSIDPLVLLQWKESLFFERLKEKVEPIQRYLCETNNNWEQVFFCFLGKSFGLNMNGEYFFSVLKKLSVINIYKHSESLIQTEAMLLGIIGALQIEDEVKDWYSSNIINEWEFLKHKYGLEEGDKKCLSFYQLRPNNFPTIRMIQFASLYFKHGSKINELFKKNLSIVEIYQFFDINISDYWTTHYSLNKESKRKIKNLTKDFIDLLFINTILPFQFEYYKSCLVIEDQSDRLADICCNLQAEKNSIAHLFSKLGLSVDNLMDSQAVLQLKKQYCDTRRCIDCLIGKSILK